jgi:hypothetical protein
MHGWASQAQILAAERDFLGSQLQAAAEHNAHLVAATEMLRSQLLQVCGQRITILLWM